MLFTDHSDLKEFLESLELIKATRDQSGPVQDTPELSIARDVGCGVIVPLPFGSDLFLAELIMEEVRKWAEARGLVRFGFVAPGDVPTLIMGLKPKDLQGSPA